MLQQTDSPGLCLGPDDGTVIFYYYYYYYYYFFCSTFFFSPASALYSVGLVTALYTGERERRCLVTPCERVLEALHCLRMNHLCFQVVPFNNCFHKE